MCMLRKILLRFALILVMTLPWLVLRAYTQGPQVYVIKDARIMTVTNGILVKGTVVIRDGLIEAVGERVGIPADARIIEGDGLTVYPGLIDAHTEVAMDVPQLSTHGSGRSGEAAPSSGVPAVP